MGREKNHSTEKEMSCEELEAPGEGDRGSLGRGPDSWGTALAKGGGDKEVRALLFRKP